MTPQAIAHFRITAKLGEGGMGEVYRATDMKLGREVAIKVLPESFAQDPGRMARFEREAQVLASLNHPNIAQIYGVEERALVMELVEGESPKGPLPVDEAAKIALQIADALEYAHEKGIVHRDLKPANIKITPDGTVKLLDFGLAKAFGSDREMPAHGENSPTLTIGATEVGVILGTASYMSPEQAAAKPVDKRADIWSFGVILWELLTGERLFDGETVSHTLADVLRAPIDFGKLASSTPELIRRLLKRCLDRNVKTRLRDIGEARILLANPAPSDPAPVMTPSQLWLGFTSWAIAGLMTLALAALAFVHVREQHPAERTLRYALPVPEKSAVHSFAISPDGRMVAIAVVIHGKQQLWLRSLETLEAQPMTGTDGAAYPFWSPDSRYIGFFTSSALKKIAASGGPAQTLGDIIGPRGGSWGQDDVILASVSAGRLKRLPAAGGAMTDVLENKGPFRYPAFLPDGRHFLYTDIKSDTAGIYLGSLDNSKTRRVLPDRSAAAFVSSPGNRTGHLLFVRESTLMAVPFDLRTSQILGDVVPVTEGVRTSGANTGYAAFSASENGVLVYSTGDLGDLAVQAVWYDRAGKSLGPMESGNILMPAISPDEKAVAFVRRMLGSPDIWVRDLVRATDTRITSGGGPNGVASVSPAWSPKAEHIVFTASGGGPFGSLYQKASSGSGEAELLLSANNARSEQWSRDGRFIVFTRIENMQLDLWVLPMDGAAADRKPVPFLKTDFNESQGQLSPDSRWMAYTSDESGQREVYVRPFPSGEGKWKISTAGGEQPRWRADGRELFYLAGDGRINAVALRALPGSKPSFEPGVPAALFDAHIYGNAANMQDLSEYDVTADGKRFLIVAPAFGAAPAPPLTVWVNWNVGLKK